jgi:hypothetical protein
MLGMGAQCRQSAKLFLQSSELGLPHPQASVPPPPPLVSGERTHSLAGEEGVEESQFRRGDMHCGTLGIYVLCGSEYTRNCVCVKSNCPLYGQLWATPLNLDCTKTTYPKLDFLRTNCWNVGPLSSLGCKGTEAESNEKRGAWDPMSELTITSPYLHSRVQHIYHGQPYARVDFIPQSETLDLASALGTSGLVLFKILFKNCSDGCPMPIQSRKIKCANSLPISKFAWYAKMHAVLSLLCINFFPEVRLFHLGFENIQ